MPPPPRRMHPVAVEWRQRRPRSRRPDPSPPSTDAGRPRRRRSLPQHRLPAGQPQRHGLRPNRAGRPTPRSSRSGAEEPGSPQVVGEPGPPPPSRPARPPRRGRRLLPVSLRHDSPGPPRRSLRLLRRRARQCSPSRPDRPPFPNANQTRATTILGRFWDRRGSAVGQPSRSVDSMKSRIVRILSIGGMLVTAPTIAVISNAASGAPVSASASSSSSPSTTPSSVSTASSAPASTPATVAAAPVPGSATQVSYVAGDAATVVLDSAGSTLRIVTFAPHPGWLTIRLEQPTATDLQVLLESVNGQVRFTASLVNGSVVTNLEAGAGPGSSVPGNSAPGNSAPDNSAPGNSAPGNSRAGGTPPRAGMTTAAGAATTTTVAPEGAATTAEAPAGAAAATDDYSRSVAGRRLGLSDGQQEGTRREPPRVPLFAGCTNRELERIARSGDEVTMTEGTLLAEQGATGREAFIVLDGTVAVKRNGRKVASLGPGVDRRRAVVARPRPADGDVDAARPTARSSSSRSATSSPSSTTCRRSGTSCWRRWPAGSASSTAPTTADPGQPTRFAGAMSAHESPGQRSRARRQPGSSPITWRSGWASASPCSPSSPASCR